MSAFHDFVRGITEEVPTGYEERGMRLYRHLVWLGASQLLEAHYPEARKQLGEEEWRLLIADFVRESHWESHYYGDLPNEFLVFLERKATV